MGAQALDVAGIKTRLDAASKNALRQFQSLGPKAVAKAADLKKLEAAMGPGPKFVNAQFVLEFNGTTITYYTQVGPAKTLLATIALASFGKPGVQRGVIQKMIDMGGGSGAASKADLEKFNKAHPPPPTPEQQGKLNQAITPLRMALRDAKADETKAIAALAAAQAAVKAAQAKLDPWLAVEKEYQKRWDAD